MPSGRLLLEVRERIIWPEVGGDDISVPHSYSSLGIHSNDHTITSDSFASGRTATGTHQRLRVRDVPFKPVIRVILWHI
jgi:hypothetical protein